jgi:hypothetical protein
MRTFFLPSFCHKKGDCWELGVFLTLGSRLEGLAFGFCLLDKIRLSLSSTVQVRKRVLAGISHVQHNALLMAVNKEKTAVQKQLENDILLSIYVIVYTCCLLLPFIGCYWLCWTSWFQWDVISLSMKLAI